MMFSARSAPDILRLLDIELHAPVAPAAPGDQRLGLEVFVASTCRLWSVRGTTVPMITCVTSSRGIALELEQLRQPHRIFVAGPARVGGDPPAAP